MKRILGAAACVLLWVSGCGDDAPSVENQATAGSKTTGAGAAGDASSPGGEGGQPVTVPVGGASGGGGEIDAGGAPSELGGAGAGGAGGSPEVLSEVSGLITSFMGTPLADVVVIIGDSSTVTDAKGAFTIADVPASYELTAIDNERKFIQVVEGLTTREPSVGIYHLRLEQHSGVVAGKLSGGGGFPLPKGQAGVVSFRGERSFGDLELKAAATSFSLSVAWEGEATQTGLLAGISWKAGPAGPAEYTGYAQHGVTLEADKIVGNINGTIAATNLALTDPAEHAVTGTLLVPGLPTLVSSNLVVGGSYVPLNLVPGPISVIVPEVDATTELAIRAEFAEGMSSSSISVPFSGNEPVDVELPPPPQLVLPIEGALGVTLDTEFSWKAAPQGTYSVISWGIGDWSIARVTAANKVKLPDLSGAGVVYDQGNYTPGWQLEQLGPASAPEEALQLLDGTSPSYGTKITTFGSAGREFQLAD
jgi:hypothetical protein